MPIFQYSFCQSVPRLTSAFQCSSKICDEKEIRDAFRVKKGDCSRQEAKYVLNSKFQRHIVFSFSGNLNPILLSLVLNGL